MKRNILQKLVEWKIKDNRKPLILNGARQVGKTYIIKEFGRLYYKNVAYVSCDTNKAVADVFAQDFNIQRILLSLSAITHEHIDPNETLVVLDEIQEIPTALNALKYFCEKAPEYHVVVAGSLLGVSLHSGVSFPVGKVDMLRMFPMTFDEFLLAIGEDGLVQALASRDYTLIKGLATSLIDSLRQYYYVGGMPGVVAEYIKSHNLQTVRELQQQILFDYRRDFSKHAPAHEVPRINLVWDSIPSQLAKDNKRFVYGALKKGARASEFEMAIQWLIDAGLVYRIYRTSSPTLPLKFYEDQSAFKLFTLDVGLMGAMTAMPAEHILVSNIQKSEYKGTFTELFVLTQLMPQELPVYYFSANDTQVEIDFLVQHGTTVSPIEVKAEVNVKSKSLRTYISKHPNLKGIRLSMLPYEEQDWMTNVPLYYVNFLF